MSIVLVLSLYPKSIFSLALFFFFFNDTATTEIYTLSLHDALPIFAGRTVHHEQALWHPNLHRRQRSEEHTSELQSRLHLVCRLLLEKKNNNISGLQLRLDISTALPVELHEQLA